MISKKTHNGKVCIDFSNTNLQEEFGKIENLELKKIFLGMYRYDSETKKAVADALRYETETGDYIGKNLEFKPGEKKTFENFIALVLHWMPDFEAYWQNEAKDLSAEDKNPGNFSKELCFFMVAKIRSIQLEPVCGVLNGVEYILADCSEETKKLLVDFLEDVQNIFGNCKINPEFFEGYLEKETKKWWDEINRFWKDLESYYLTKQGLKTI